MFEGNLKLRWVLKDIFKPLYTQGTSVGNRVLYEQKRNICVYTKKRAFHKPRHVFTMLMLSKNIWEEVILFWNEKYGVMKQIYDFL